MTGIISILSAAGNFIMEFGKQIALFSFAILGLWGFGITIDTYVNFTFLTQFFILIRRMLLIFDFAFDIPTLCKLFGYAMLIQVGYWILRSYFSLTQFFNTK